MFKGAHLPSGKLTPWPVRQCMGGWVIVRAGLYGYGDEKISSLSTGDRTPDPLARSQSLSRPPMAARALTRFISYVFQFK
jgi:hypothetical protein